MNERIRSSAVAAISVAAAALALLLPFATPVAAQHADFLFRRPLVTAVVRGGWAVPRAQSDIFDFTTQKLTASRGDFAGGQVDFEIGVRANDHVDISLGVGHSQSTVHSEFRDFVEDDGSAAGLPIRQWTELQRTPFEIGVKAYLRERGRAVSRYAWVPYAWAPYLSGGVGGMNYRFEQSGDFVDYQTSDIFTKDFVSEGTTPTAHLGAGLDLSLGPHLIATGEGRYQWARADMSDDFQGFDRIDLSGFQVTVGLGVRF
jgi:hypothetical protein